MSFCVGASESMARLLTCTLKETHSSILGSDQMISGINESVRERDAGCRLNAAHDPALIVRQLRVLRRRRAGSRAREHNAHYPKADND
jgi:hypothetical protein